MNKIKFLLLGFLTSLIFPPYFFFPLGFIVFTYLCLFIENIYKNYNKKNIFILVFIFAFTFFGSFLFWIINPFLMLEDTKNYFYLSILLIILLSFIFCFIFLVLISLNKFLSPFFLIPLIFIIFEIIISIFLYGFPWITFSLISSNIDLYLLSIKHFGTIITSYITIQVFCIPYLFLTFKIKKNYYLFFVFLTSPLFIFYFYNNFSNKQFNDSPIKDLKIEIFQLNINNNFEKNNPKLNLNNIINLITNSNADLIIFGENNYPYLINKNEFKKIKSILKNEQSLIIGGTRILSKKYFNTMALINNENTNFFDKKILVPFGEFLPFRNFLKFLQPISGSVDYTAGINDRTIIINNDYNFIPVICYEIIFYWKLINQTNSENDLIINITNDIWFGNLLGPYQHFYLTKLRAAEFNKHVIRVSNNGISGIINNNGKIIRNSNLNEFSNIKNKISLKKSKNFYFTHTLLNYYLYFIIIVVLFLNNIYLWKLSAKRKSKL